AVMALSCGHALVPACADRRKKLLIARACEKLCSPRTRSLELIGDARASNPLVGVTCDPDDRRGGVAACHAPILDAADEDEALAQVTRKRIGARRADRIFAGGRLATSAVIDRQPACVAARLVNVEIIISEALAIDVHRRRKADIGALRNGGAIFDRRRSNPAAVAAGNIL